MNNSVEILNKIVSNIEKVIVWKKESYRVDINITYLRWTCFD